MKRRATCTWFIREEDHQHHASTESSIRKYHDAILDSNFQAITEKDVSDVFESIIPRKSLSWDSPTVPILPKKTASAIAPSLGIMLKHCMDKGSWPTKWKIGKWTPLFRKGDKQAEENYRPIIILPVLGKVLQHLLHWKLKRSLSAPKRQFSPVGQRLIQLLLEPFEHNLRQTISIKMRFQPTLTHPSCCIQTIQKNPCLGEWPLTQWQYTCKPFIRQLSRSELTNKRTSDRAIGDPIWKMLSFVFRCISKVI